MFGPVVLDLIKRAADLAETTHYGHHGGAMEHLRVRQ